MQHREGYPRLGKGLMDFSGEGKSHPADLAACVGVKQVEESTSSFPKLTSEFTKSRNRDLDYSLLHFLNLFIICKLMDFI